MTDDQKTSFDALDVLRAAAWTSFDRRRNYEWKMAIALWTALAAFTATILTRAPGVSVLHGVAAKIIVTLGAVAIVAVHAFWSHHCKLRNDRDRRLSIIFHRKMCEMLGMDYQKEVEQAIFQNFGNPHQPSEGLRNYWHLSQISITVILTLMACMATIAAS